MGAQKRKRPHVENNNKDTTVYGPPTKKPRTNHKKSTNNSKPKKKGNIRMFFQTSDFTEEQIQNILTNTTKGIDRPLIIFHDNWDNFFLRCVRNNDYARKRRCINELLDDNSKLLSKYEDWWNEDFLSFGIITDFKNKAMYEADKFEVNVNSNFEMLYSIVDTLKIKEIIIPSKAAVSHVFWAPNLNKKQLQYIHSKLEEFQTKYVKKLIFIDDQVPLGDVELNHNNLADITKQTKHEIRQKQSAIKEKCKPTLEVQETVSTSDDDDDDEKVIHSLHDQKHDTEHENDGYHTHNECQCRQVLMQRVMQQQRMIMDQQTELRLTKHAMVQHNMDRMAMRRNVGGNVHKQWAMFNMIATVISIIVVFGIVFVVILFGSVVSDPYMDISQIHWGVISTIDWFWIFVVLIVVYYVFPKRRSTHYMHNRRRRLFNYCIAAVFIMITVCVLRYLTLSTFIAHIIDIDDMNGDDTVHMDSVEGDTMNNILCSLCGAVLWCIVVFILSHRISRSPVTAFVLMSIGGPFMYFSMYIISCIISRFYGNNDTMSNEERLQILWWFISCCLLPTFMIAVFIGYLIQIASTSQFRYIINWKSFGKLVLGMLVFYAMIYHIMLTFYAFVGFGFFYIILQCFTVSGGPIKDKRENGSRIYVDNAYSTPINII